MVSFNLFENESHILIYCFLQYFSGGWEESDGQRRLVSAIECFDLSNEEISIVTHMHTPRYHAGITMIKNQIWFIGGFASDGKKIFADLESTSLNFHFHFRYFPPHSNIH